MMTSIISDPRWKWIPGMAWCFKSNPDKVYRVIGDESWRRHKKSTRTPVAADPATAGCLWHLVQSSLREKYNGYTLELSYDHVRGAYVITLYDVAGVASFEATGQHSGRCALLTLQWLWFKPEKS